MENYCEDCGYRVYNGACTNCHEELFILEQYYELDMELPKDDSLFMQRVFDHQKKINQKNTNNV